MQIIESESTKRKKKGKYKAKNDQKFKSYWSLLEPKSYVKDMTAKVKTFAQIMSEEDPDGTKHDLRLICVKCGNVQTCRCSKPKRPMNGICQECADGKS